MASRRLDGKGPAWLVLSPWPREFSGPDVAAACAAGARSGWLSEGRLVLVANSNEKADGPPSGTQAAVAAGQAGIDRGIQCPVVDNRSHTVLSSYLEPAQRWHPGRNLNVGASRAADQALAARR